MGARFQPSQYAEGTVLSTGEEIPFVLKRYKRSGPSIVDELMLRDEFDAAVAAAEEAVEKASEVADYVLAEDKPVEKRPVTYLALGIFVVAAFLSTRNRPVIKLGSAKLTDLLAQEPTP
jgi:hypothetical protein